MKTSDKPLVYACSGRSNVAQLAHDIAVVMDREGHAQMACITGVGGGLEAMVAQARSGRKICALDACPLACVKHTLQRCGVKPDWHFELLRLGVKQTGEQSCSLQENFQVLRHVYNEMDIIARD